MGDSSMQTISNLLTRIIGIIEKYRNIDCLTGANYNLFKIVGIDTTETIICKVIADLLNPQGSHYKDDIYLKLFKNMVLSNTKIQRYKCLNTEKAVVSTEYSTPEGRRIDIVINSNIFIPIEAKIHAPDQEKQILDYWEYSKDKNGEGIPVLYLTIHGESPSEYSNPQDQEHTYRRSCISFSEDMLSWLDACLKCPETIKTAPVREIIIQLIAVIKSFCGIPEDENVGNEIFGLITSNVENYQAAQSVVEAYSSVTKKIEKIFKDEMLQQLKKVGIENSHWDPDKGGCYGIQINENTDYYVYAMWNQHQVFSDKDLDDKEEINQISKIMGTVPPDSREKWSSYKTDGKKTVWLSEKVPLKFDLDLAGIGKSNNWYDDSITSRFVLYKLYSEHSDVVIKKIAENVAALKEILP